MAGAEAGYAAPAAGLPEAACGDGAGPQAVGQLPDRVPLRELMDDRLLDALLERSRDQAGGLRLIGEGSMLGELVKAVLERALEAELSAPRGALSYRPRSGHGLEEVSVGLMAYLDP